MKNELITLVELTKYILINNINENDIITANNTDFQVKDISLANHNVYCTTQYNEKLYKYINDFNSTINAVLNLYHNQSIYVNTFYIDDITLIIEIEIY